MNKVEMLNKTKDYLLDKGWAQCAFEDTDGKVCILGAINRVAGYNASTLKDQIYMDMVGVLNTNLGFTCGVMQWNDDDERTFNDVMGLLDEMILTAKQEEANE